MKPSLLRSKESLSKGGFNLVEVTLSLGLMSFGFLALIPLLALGIKTSRLARDDRDTSQIAQTLIQEARQGTLATGAIYLDADGTPCSSTQAAYIAQGTSAQQPSNTSLTKLTLRITPVGAPDRVRTYAVVFQPQS